MSNNARRCDSQERPTSSVTVLFFGYTTGTGNRGPCAKIRYLTSAVTGVWLTSPVRTAMRFLVLASAIACAATVHAHATVFGVWVNQVFQYVMLSKFPEIYLVYEIRGDGRNLYIRSPPNNNVGTPNVPEKSTEKIYIACEGLNIDCHDLQCEQQPYAISRDSLHLSDCLR